MVADPVRRNPWGARLAERLNSSVFMMSSGPPTSGDMGCLGCWGFILCGWEGVGGVDGGYGLTGRGWEEVGGLGEGSVWGVGRWEGVGGGEYM